MKEPSSFSPVLATLAQSFSAQADTVLDLREAVLEGRRPGLCVQCYFKLLGTSRPGRVDRELTGLRRWIEAHIQIEASGPDRECLETMPLELGEAEDLEAFCRGVSSTVFWDRADLPSRVELNFAFRSDPAA